MGRIKIKDLPEDAKVNREDMKKVLGGITSEPITRPRSTSAAGIIVVCKPKDFPGIDWQPKGYPEPSF